MREECRRAHTTGELREPEPRARGIRMVPPPPLPPAPPGFAGPPSSGGDDPSGGALALVRALEPGLLELATLSTCLETCRVLPGDPDLELDMGSTMGLALTMLRTRLEQIDAAVTVGEIRMPQSHWNQFRTALLERSGPCPPVDDPWRHLIANDPREKCDAWLHLSPAESWDLERHHGHEFLRSAVRLLIERIAEENGTDDLDRFTHRMKSGFMAVYLAGMIAVSGETFRAPGRPQLLVPSAPFAVRSFAPRNCAGTETPAGSLRGLVQGGGAMPSMTRSEEAFRATLLAAVDDLRSIRLRLQLNAEGAAEDPDREECGLRTGVPLYRERFQSRWLSLLPYARCSDGSETIPRLERIAEWARSQELFPEVMSADKERVGATEWLIRQLAQLAHAPSLYVDLTSFEQRVWEPVVRLLQATNEQMPAPPEAA